jgi:LPXTG-motif cell wall-anchored protein
MSDTLKTEIDGQKMSKGTSALDQSALMVPAVGIGLSLVLMAAFYVYYRRKKNRHSLHRLRRENIPAEKVSGSRRKRAQTLAEAGGLPPVRPSGKEAAS